MNHGYIRKYVWNNRGTKIYFYDNKIEGKLNGSFEKDRIRTDFQWFIDEEYLRLLVFKL